MDITYVVLRAFVALVPGGEIENLRVNSTV
jgi:hypothetical protein